MANLFPHSVWIKMRETDQSGMTTYRRGGGEVLLTAVKNLVLAGLSLVKNISE